MLQQAMRMASTLRIGLRVKEAVRRQAMQAALMALAGALVLAALVFVLLAVYSALIEAEFGPVASAALMAAGLLLLAFMVLAAMQIARRRRARRAVPAFASADPARQALDYGEAAGEALSDLDRRLGQVVQQVGPLGVIAAAFAIGLAAGRRRERS